MPKPKTLEIVIIMEVYIKSSHHIKAPVKERVPVEGHTNDIDGAPIELLIHVIDGYINELEVVKLDGSPLLRPVDADKIQVLARE